MKCGFYSYFHAQSTPFLLRFYHPHAMQFHEDYVFFFRNQKLSNPRFLCMNFRNGILLPKLFCSTVRKNCSSDREKLLKFEAECREFAYFLRPLNRTIYQNSESSEQILVTECFFNLFLEVSHI